MARNSITLQNLTDTDVQDNDILGQLCFAAPNETGTDAIAIIASIFARAEEQFAADANATELVFVTSDTESSTPTGSNGDMTLSSAGLLTITDDLIIKAGGTIGGSADTDLLTLGTGTLTVAGTTKIGASAGSGQDFYAYTAGAAAHVGLHWDADGNTEGTLIGGADGHGVDFKFFGETASSYIHWDQSGDDLIVSASDIITQDASTNNIISLTAAGKITMGINGAREIRVDNSVSGTDEDGSNLILRAGKGTGAGVGGDILFHTSPAGGSGTSTNAHAVAVTIGGNGEVTFAKSVNQAPNTATDSGSIAIDCGASNYHEILMSGDATSVVFTNATAGQRVVVRFKQHSSHIDLNSSEGWNTVTVNGSSATVTWPGGTIPTLTETNNAIDVYGFIFQNTVTNVHAFIIGQALA